MHGITLIALVVTIVVLLILSSVTISAIFSDNGIIKKAQEAANKTKEAVEREQAELNQLYNDLEDALNNSPDNTARTLVELYDAGELKIGDYVNYQNPTSGSYTSLGSKTGMDTEITDGGDPDQIFNVANNQLTWRVLGKDEATGGIKLIAGSPMKRESNSSYDDLIGITKDPYYYLNGAKGYINAETELNNICALYKNDLAQTARSVTIEDINQVLGIKTEEDIKKANVLPMMTGSLQYGEIYNFENHYTPESWLDGKRTTTVTGTVDGYGFIINPPSEMGITSVTLEDERTYNLLFDNVEYGSTIWKPYWLASRGVYAHLVGIARFGPGVVYAEGGMTVAGTGVVYLFGSDGDELNHGLAVRPVVVLKSNVTEDSIHKIDDQTEEEWNYGGRN